MPDFPGKAETSLPHPLRDVHRFGHLLDYCVVCKQDWGPTPMDWEKI